MNATCLCCRRVISIELPKRRGEYVGEVRAVSNAARSAGWLKRHVGRRFGFVCPACLPGVIEAAKPKPKPRKPSAVNVEEARRLIAEGWSLAQLAERYGVTKQAVQQKLRRSAAV